LKPSPNATAVKDDIRSAFGRNATIEADDLSVSISNCTVADH
jgi:hypothetical protein